MPRYAPLTTRVLLEKAIILATEAHRGQLNKVGDMPYILHPLRVMAALNDGTDSEECRKDMIVGILHDVVEDTYITLEILKSEGFTDDLLQDIDNLSHIDNEPGEIYCARIRRSARGIRVKDKDLDDNTSDERMNNLDVDTLTRLSIKYTKYRKWIHQNDS
jgi:(p)ppGpp synthase/HD superfamily hydrolase